jgi:hypothetical protein
VSGELKVSLGVREDGSVVHITELDEQTERGLGCHCVCSECGDRLIARLGKVRQRHFAHHTEQNCTTSDESALHRFAKEVFLRHNEFKVPDVAVCLDRTYMTPVRPQPDAPAWQQNYESMTIYPAQYVQYMGAVLERNITESLRPDVTLERAQGKAPLLVEVLVTHAVDEGKEALLKALGHPCVEIDLSNLHVGLDSFDRDGIEQLLIHGGGDEKHWVCFPESDKYEAQLREKLRVEREQERLAYEEDRRAQERKRQAEAERVRKREEWIVRTRAKRLERQDELLSPESVAQDDRRKEAELADHPLWKRNSRILGISADNIPYYLNHPLPGEYLFTCHRAIWQSALFIPWVYNKKDMKRSRDIHIEFATTNLKEKNPELLVEELYWAFRERQEARSVAEVIAGYFGFLMRCGFVKHDYAAGGREAFTWVYSCLLPQVIHLPPELNSPRYRFGTKGIVDSETGEVVAPCS